MAIHNRVYSVRAGANGKAEVIVNSAAIALRGERMAVAQATWFQLLGKNSLGEDVNKNIYTRQIIMDEIFSRLEKDQPLVYETFMVKIRFKYIRIAGGELG